MKEPWAWNRSKSNLRDGGQKFISAGAFRTQKQLLSPESLGALGGPSPMTVSAIISWWGGLSFILYFLKIKIPSDLWINLLPVSGVCVWGGVVPHSDKQLGPKLLLFLVEGSSLCLWLKSGAGAGCEPSGEFLGCICRIPGLYRPCF